MEKNYYELLEVDKNASDEIIEKAYKILVKRYHPDLQNGILKNQYQEKMKEINEAYSVLSDGNKKSIYDEQLKESIISKEEYQNIVQENMLLRQEIQKLQNNYQTQKVYSQNYENLQRQAVNQAYQDAYVDDMKNRGYRFKRKRTLKEYIKLVGVIAGIILFIILIAQIPAVEKFFISIYENNIVIKALVDTFKTGF